MALSTRLLLKLGAQMRRPYIIQTASNCVALRATGVRTYPHNDAATDTSIQGRKKHCNLCPGIGEAIRIQH